MAIEFRCTNCNRLLRTGDDTGGKQAKCPECGTVMAIPSAATVVDAAPPPQPAFSEQPPAQSAAAITPSHLDIGDVFNRTWTVFKPNWGRCLGVVVLVWLISFGVGLGAGIMGIFIPLVGDLISMLFRLWLGIGVALYFLKTARGVKVEISEIFTGWPYFGRVLLASILIGLIIFGICLVCAIPALVCLAISKELAVLLAIVAGVVALVAMIYVQLSLSQFMYLIIDRNVDVIESLKMSYELMTGNKLTLFLIGILTFLITIAAMIPLLLGLLFTAPFFAVMAPVIYLCVTGQPIADPSRHDLSSPTGGF